MRTKSILVGYLVIGLAFAMVSGSGLAAAWGMTGAPTDGGSTDALEAANSSSPIKGNDLQGDASSPTGDGDLASLIINGGQALTKTIGAVVGWPLALANLGAPSWFAEPVGWFAVVIGGIGMIQFVTNRVYQ